MAAKRDGAVIVKFTVTAGSMNDDAPADHEPDRPSFITSFTYVDASEDRRLGSTGDIVWTLDEFTDLMASGLKALEASAPGGMNLALDQARRELADDEPGDGERGLRGD